MADETKNIKIVGWPEEGKARLEHEFLMEEPCPVSILFLKPPANVVIHTSEKEPLHVDMKMRVSAEDTFPVCISLCEPICADSSYTVGVEIFDRPVGVIRFQGRTKVFNCREEEPPELVCVDFSDQKPKQRFTEPFTHHGLRFVPLDGVLYTTLDGEPAGETKLAFGSPGIRIEFPAPVDFVQLKVGNRGGPTLEFSVFVGASIAYQFSEDLFNETKDIWIEQPGTTALEIRGDNLEGLLVEVCADTLEG